MPRRRPKTRVEHIADALTLAQEAQECLALIDMRRTRGELKEAVKGAKLALEAAVGDLSRAMTVDVPTLQPSANGRALNGSGALHPGSLAKASS